MLLLNEPINSGEAKKTKIGDFLRDRPDLWGLFDDEDISKPWYASTVVVIGQFLASDTKILLQSTFKC